VNEELSNAFFPSCGDLVRRFGLYLDAHGHDRGYLALELNDYGNFARAPEFVAACDSTDGRVLPVGWLTRDFTGASARAMVDTAGVRGAILEAEIPAEIMVGGEPRANPQAPDWNEVADAFSDYPHDRAVATSFGPFTHYVREPDGWALRPDPVKAKPLIDGGWYLMPYVYPAEHATATVESQMFYATHYPGWYAPEPVLGVYGGFTLSHPAFDGYQECAGYSLWDAGEVL